MITIYEIGFFFRNGASLGRLLNTLRETGSEYDWQACRSDGYTFIYSLSGSPETAVLNKLNKLRQLESTAAVSSRMGINQMGFGSHPDHPLQCFYRVHVFDQRVLRLEQKTSHTGQYRVTRASCKRERKACQLARRALHILGLDFGMVTIGAGSGENLSVVKVSPAPELWGKTLALYAQALTAFFHNLRQGQPPPMVMLGADPEFMLQNTRSGRMVPASVFFGRQGVVGCDNMRIPNGKEHPIAELRPAPCDCPLGLSDGLYQALLQANRKTPYKNLKWLAGSQPFNGYFTGGHIHFSGIELSASLLKALDNYLGIPVMMLENQDTASLRRRKYGFLGETRSKKHGGFEYRTPGSWLVTPEFTRAVLCLAKIVASHYPLLKRNLLESIAAQQAFYQSDKDYFRPLFQDLWNDIGSTPSYAAYREQLQLIPELVGSGSGWQERQDIRKSWNLPAYKRRYLP